MKDKDYTTNEDTNDDKDDIDELDEAENLRRDDELYRHAYPRRRRRLDLD